MKTTQTQIKANKTPESDNQRNETRLAYVEKSTDSANYANPLYIVHYPDGTKYSTMQEAHARKTADNFNASAPAQAQPKKQQFDFKADLTKEAPAGKSFKDAAQAQHSPLPWHLSGYHSFKVVARSRGDATICDCTNPVFQDLREQEENARLIVRACNNAQRLADALELCLVFLPTEATSCESKAREALAEWSKAQ